MTATERDLTRLSVTTCADCPTARRSYETTGGAVVCSCGTVYAPEGFVWPTAPVRPVPELPEDSRVQVIRLADVATQTTVRLLRPVEDSELVRVRAVLFELRPDRDGPLGGDVSRPVAVIDRPVVRLAGSGAGGGDLPRGAFAPVVKTGRGTLAAERVEKIRARDPQAGETLRWMQRTAVWTEDLVSFFRAAGRAFVDAEKRARWDALPDTVRHERERVSGRTRVLHACDVWEAEP